MLSFPRGKAGIPGQGDAGGAADSSGRGIKRKDPAFENRTASETEGISEPWNSGRDFAGCAYVVMWERRNPWKSVLFLKLLQ